LYLEGGCTADFRTSIPRDIVQSEKIFRSIV